MICFIWVKNVIFEWGLRPVIILVHCLMAVPKEVCNLFPVPIVIVHCQYNIVWLQVRERVCVCFHACSPQNGMKTSGEYFYVHPVFPGLSPVIWNFGTAFPLLFDGEHLSSHLKLSFSLKENFHRSRTFEGVSECVLPLGYLYFRVKNSCAVMVNRTWPHFFVRWMPRVRFQCCVSSIAYPSILPTFWLQLTVLFICYKSSKSFKITWGPVHENDLSVLAHTRKENGREEGWACSCVCLFILLYIFIIHHIISTNDHLIY